MVNYGVSLHCICTDEHLQQVRIQESFMLTPVMTCDLGPVIRTNYMHVQKHTVAANKS